MRPLGRIALFLCAAGCLTACTEVVDSAVESRYAQYNYSTDWAKNEAILLNIVRASEYQPLNFMSFQPYQGTASVTGAASSPSFILGPARVNSQKQYSLGQGSLTATATGSGTVTVTTLDTQNFYQAVLASVDFADLYRFQGQGYPRELLFRLFTDYVSLTPTSSERSSFAGIVYNDPAKLKRCLWLPPGLVQLLYGSSPQDYQKRICFEDLVEFALLSGLSSEIRTVSNPSASSKTTANPSNQNTNSNSNSDSSAPKAITEGRLCFDPALEARALSLTLEMSSRLTVPVPNPHRLATAQYHPICGIDYWPPSLQATAAQPANPLSQAKAAERAAAEAKSTAAQAILNAQGKSSDSIEAAAAMKAKNDAVTATEKMAAAEAAAKQPARKTSGVAAPGGNSSSGVSRLTVIITQKTGFPVWDIHLPGFGAHVVEIGTRSTFSIYNFLGRLLNNQESHANEMIGLPLDENYDSHLLTVVKGQAAGCFVTALIDGVYCVPNNNAQNTKSTFSILSQLLALKTTTNDLQLLPTIRLLPTD